MIFKALLRDQLAVKQAKYTVMIAVTLGLLASFLQITTDYFSTRNKFGTTTQQLLQVVKIPASQAAFSFDDIYARETLKGLFVYPSIHHAIIYDDAGRKMAEIIRETKDSGDRWLTNILFGQTVETLIPLKVTVSNSSNSNIFLDTEIDQDALDVGQIKVVADTHVEGSEFLSRSINILLTGVLRNMVLAIFLLIFFQRFITRPIISLQQELQQIDPNHPDKARLSISQSHKDDALGHLVETTNNLLNAIEKETQERFDQIKEASRLTADIDRRKIREQTMLKYQNQLKESNQKLQQTLDELTSTQRQLVEKEKLASLGDLVAGIAHEINTPIGISVTATSHILEKEKIVNEKLARNDIKRSEIDEFLSHTRHALEIVMNNINRAAQLIQSFKQISADQASEHKRTFHLHEYLQDIINSLAPKFTGTKHITKIDCDKNIILESFPGFFSQIFTNLVINSLTHGFEDIEQGTIQIEVKIDNDDLTIHYQDDGKGISPKSMDKLFTPFFTTKRNQGGTGLGTTILYNLVTQTLGGHISCQAVESGGLRFDITFSLTNSAIKVVKYIDEEN